MTPPVSSGLNGEWPPRGRVDAFVRWPYWDHPAAASRYPIGTCRGSWGCLPGHAIHAVASGFKVDSGYLSLHKHPDTCMLFYRFWGTCPLCHRQLSVGTALYPQGVGWYPESWGELWGALLPRHLRVDPDWRRRPMEQPDAATLRQG
jgi:hypothetical protein